MTMIKKTALIMIMGLSSASAFAASDGFYMGLNAGISNAHYTTSSFTGLTSASITKNGLAGGVNFGYQINPMFATELGYTRAHNVHYSNLIYGGNTTLANSSISLGIFDFAVRGMMPLKSGFGLNAKLGVAHVKAEPDGGLLNDALGSMYRDNTKWMPEAGLGASYDINQFVSTGINFTRIFKSGNIPNIDLGTLNVSYHFG